MMRHGDAREGWARRHGVRVLILGGLLCAWDMAMGPPASVPPVFFGGTPVDVFRGFVEKTWNR